MSINETIAQTYRDHSAAIRGKALQMTGDHELAADVTQEAFLRLFVEASANRMPDSIPAWLYRTSANLIVSRARHLAVAHRYAPRLLRDWQPAQPDAIAVLHEDRDAVSAALSKLPASDQLVLVMAAHGARGREIALRLGRSEVATRALLSRARERLRAGLIDTSAGTAA